MPKKGKQKGPAIITTPEAVLEHTGFMPRDIVLAPFGAQLEIVGVQMMQRPFSRDSGVQREDDSAMETVAKVWAKLPDGTQVPLRPSTAREFEEFGYQRVHEAIHIVRDTQLFEQRITDLLATGGEAPKKKKKPKAEGKDGKGAKKKK